MRSFVLLAVITTGCITFVSRPHDPFVKSLFHAEFKCPKEKVTVENTSGGDFFYLAKGCNREEKYVCFEAGKPAEPMLVISGASDCERIPN
jgi:hypothetical protein